MIDTDKYEGREALRQYLSSASIDLRMKPHFETYEDLLAEVERLREQQKKILEIVETNMALEWSDTDASIEWGAVADIIKGWIE